MEAVYAVAVIGGRGFIALAVSTQSFPLSSPVIPAKAGIQRTAVRELAGQVRAAGSAGVPARNTARKRGDTLILAFSHKGRRDPLVGICT